MPHETGYIVKAMYQLIMIEYHSLAELWHPTSMSIDTATICTGMCRSVKIVGDEEHVTD